MTLRLITVLRGNFPRTSARFLNPSHLSVPRNMRHSSIFKCQDRGTGQNRDTGQNRGTGHSYILALEAAHEAQSLKSFSSDTDLLL
jgi:hypothetical protein